MAFFVFNDIKIKVWKFENKPRAYFRGGLFSGLFSCSDLGGLFSGVGLFSGGLIFRILRYVDEPRNMLKKRLKTENNGKWRQNWGGV